MSRKETMTFEEWLQQGLTNGWCGPAVCETHDGLPMSTEEDSEFELGGDPCIHIIRLYDDESVKLSVEQNHSPSVWRATNSGYTLGEEGN
jgi:hypothetical protein